MDYSNKSKKIKVGLLLLVDQMELDLECVKILLFKDSIYALLLETKKKLKKSYRKLENIVLKI